MLGIFKTFAEKLAQTRQAITGNFSSLFAHSSLTEEEWLSFEEHLYQADFGVEVVEMILKRMKAEIKRYPSGQDCLRKIFTELIQGSEGTVPSTDPSQATEDTPHSLQVFLLLGINGAGKTTTAAKLANFWQQNGQKVLLGSCDTFRAAADIQLKTWAERLQLDCIGSQPGADAAAVAYDVCQAGMHRGYQSVLLDTAGRLHTKHSLMEELKKMIRVLQKCNASFPQHRWLVLDGSLGTNSVQQAQLFHEAVGLTGLILTKLDGTSKGGALLSIFHTLHIPIYFIGLGEKAEDLQPFSAAAYIEALIENA
ncbi:MAG: signal recognition particle-docking protein FtsY [Opitutales bacterium]|nr:signal recognition particle-docking protein FtsY [Opitutales bacterium]